MGVGEDVEQGERGQELDAVSGHSAPSWASPSSVLPSSVLPKSLVAALQVECLLHFSQGCISKPVLSPGGAHSIPAG
jgi:hypothetical protein